ncbi:MAG: hypothetical protein KBT36_12910 [Kurthia sp.]|nr:hypothetical protein [Candidatus Kurthia equi]
MSENIEKEEGTSRVDPFEQPEEYQVYIQKYTKFHLEEVEPKIKQLISAPTKKERKAIQEQIVKVIEENGYTHESSAMAAMFNL